MEIQPHTCIRHTFGPGLLSLVLPQKHGVASPPPGGGGVGAGGPEFGIGQV